MVTATMAAQAEDAPYRRLGRRIATLRENRRWTQRELADIVHISPGYMPQIEGGRRRPDPAILRVLAAALGADYDTDLGVLAGYTTPPAGDEPVRVAPEDRRLVERFARLPRVAKETAIAAGDRVAELLGAWLSDTGGPLDLDQRPVEDQAHREPDAEPREQAE
jgi:transcriptional regulator with XRE-family HTH domain